MNSPSEVYAIAKQTAAEDYKIGEEDPEHHKFATEPQWYSHEGGRQSRGAGDFVQLDDRSVQLSLVVEVEELAPKFETLVVKVTPVVFQHISGSPKPRPLEPNDPNMPGWVGGRVESLELAIHKAARNFVVKP